MSSVSALYIGLLSYSTHPPDVPRLSAFPTYLHTFSSHPSSDIYTTLFPQSVAISSLIFLNVSLCTTPVADSCSMLLVCSYLLSIPARQTDGQTVRRHFVCSWVGHSSRSPTCSLEEQNFGLTKRSGLGPGQTAQCFHSFAVWKNLFGIGLDRRNNYKKLRQAINRSTTNQKMSIIGRRSSCR